MNWVSCCDSTSPLAGIRPRRGEGVLCLSQGVPETPVHRLRARAGVSGLQGYCHIEGQETGIRGLIGSAEYSVSREPSAKFLS